MNLILFEPGEVGDDGRTTVRDGRARHLLKVLHVSPGQQIRMGVVDGRKGIGIVTAIDAGSVSLYCTFEPSIPERPRVDLLLAVPRPKVLRRLWAQIAALGVGQVILTNAEKVERDYFDSHVMNETGYRPLLIEGLQQAQDTRVPRVSIHKQFRVLVEDDLNDLFPAGRRIVAHPGAERSLRAVLEPDSDERVLIAIGPEGGWNDFELTLLQRHGFVRAGLSSRTLATTTACIAVLSVVHEMRG